MEVFLLFLLVGVLAQAVDGALGMAYGVVSSSVLLAFGVPPAMASATVHAAEVFTTGASATSHILHK
ncbi:MAG TPA: TSUP family transporter, partial [Caulobacteraceae bacterium]